MGKFRMSHGKDMVVKAPITAIPEVIVRNPGQHYATRDEVQKAMHDVLEKHKAAFEALAKHDTEETYPAAIEAQPETIPKNVDNWARKHSVESRKQLIADLKRLDNDIYQHQLTNDIIIGNMDHRILELESIKSEEKQIVTEITKEITVMKSEIPKSIWIGMGILLVLNILTIMIK